MRLTIQMFQHLINQEYRKVIIPSCIIQSLVVNAYYPTMLHPSMNQLNVLFLTIVSLVFVGTTCTRLTQLLSEMRYMIPTCKSLVTFFLTTFKINGLSRLMGCLTDFSQV